MEQETITYIAHLFRDQNYQLYEVGGRVRDNLLGIRSSDIDLTTNAKPKAILSILGAERVEQEKGWRIYTTGIDFGTISIITPECVKVEITTYRKEVYPTDSRKPRVVFGDSLEDDLSRRDFTINAIAYDPLEHVYYDPFEGRRHLQRKVLQCVGCSAARFSEDPLRMMRGVRFAIKYGLETGYIIQESTAKRLQIVSAERMQDELNKILLLDPAVGISMLAEQGLLRQFIPEFDALKFVSQGKYHIKDVLGHTYDVLGKVGQIQLTDEDNLILRLAALFHDFGKPAAKTIYAEGIHFHQHEVIGAKITTNVMHRLKYSNDRIDRVVKLVDNHMRPLGSVLGAKPVKIGVINRLIRDLGEENIFLLMILARADISSSRNPYMEYLDCLEEKIIASLVKEEPMKIKSPIDGNIIMSRLGVPEGTMVGVIKNWLRDMVVEGKLDKDDQEKALEEARKRWEGIRYGSI